MKIAIASDRRGFELKKFLIQELEKKGNTLIDCGSNNPEEAVDYPDYAKEVCRSILENNSDYGILICGTGIGMSIAANRFKNIRAGRCCTIEDAKITREHNNANVICLGADRITENLALECVEVFLKTEFTKDERHQRRIEKIDSI